MPESVMMLRPVERLGAAAVGVGALAADVTSALWTLGVIGARPGAWTRPVRREFIRQCYFTGVQPLGLVMLLACLSGVAVVALALRWLHAVGQIGLAGPLIATAVIREGAPLLVNIVMLGWSGTAVTAEVATLKASGAARMLASHGMDPMGTIVLPRAAAMATCAVALCAVFAATMLTVGYTVAAMMGVASFTPVGFLNALLRELSPWELLAVGVKAGLVASITGTICCLQGLSARSSLTEISRVLPLAFVGSMTAMFVLSAAFSLVL